MRFSYLLLLALPAFCQDEFTGPFRSWTDVHSYGAHGKGSGDDSDALQAALSNLGVPPYSPVLYIPSGTYVVSKPLVLANRIGVSIVGEDPASVRIKWTGPQGAAMLTLNGVAFSRISRITFDGGGSAAVLVDQAWQGSGSPFDCGNEYVDDVFMGGGVGIRGGNLGHGFAETSVIRAKFLSLDSGILLKNFNALDLWVWDSLFDHCNFGVTNSPGAGNYHVYNSKFLYSGTADNMIGNTGGFSFVGNYSTGSVPFVGSVFTVNPAYITIQGNRINPAPNAVASSINLFNQGPLIMIDNQIGNLPYSMAAIWAMNQSDIDVFSAGNRFAGAAYAKVNGRLTSIDDLPSQSLNLSEPLLPPTPPAVTRKVFDVRSGAGSAEIQSAIDSAVKFKGDRPIVHLPFGDYSAISVTVPSSDIQIIGDGLEATRLMGSIRLDGPASHVTLSDFTIRSSSGTGDGIRVGGADQPGSRVHLNQVQGWGSGINVFADGVNNALVDMRNSNHVQSRDASVKLDGSAAIKVFSGASYGNALSYSLSRGSLLVRDMWYDSLGGAFLKATGPSSVTISGSQISTPGGPTTLSFDFSNFTGIGALVGSQFCGQATVSGSSTGSVLAAGAVGPSQSYLINQSSARTVVVNSKQFLLEPDRTSGSIAVPDQGIADQSFLTSSLAQMRAGLPNRIDSLPSTVTDVRLYRVGVANFGVGLHIAP